MINKMSRKNNIESQANNSSEAHNKNTRKIQLWFFCLFHLIYVFVLINLMFFVSEDKDVYTSFGLMAILLSLMIFFFKPKN